MIMQTKRLFVVFGLMLGMMFCAGCVFEEQDSPTGGGGGGGSGGSNNNVTTIVTSEGTVLRGGSLTAKLDWLDRSAESHNTYILEVNANQNIAPRTLRYQGAINITVILRGDENNRTIRLSSNGNMFQVRGNVTLVLDNNITLHGHSGNTDGGFFLGSLIWIVDGNLVMNNGSTITGDAMTGVRLHGGNFEMNGGTISNNQGGGVDLLSGTFNMHSGTITGNTKYGGVRTSLNGGAFNMYGGTITGNTADRGGGVNFTAGSFNMYGGTISNNIAREYGGGVYGNINKTGGTITGYNSDQSNGNVVKDGSGNILARRGHAVYVSSDRRKETTAGTSVNLSSSSAENWDE